MIAALFVETGGGYFGLSDVDPWDITRDARNYTGPHPVVAHPPCERWGRYWHGSPVQPHRFYLGDDKGCFTAAITALRRWGGVLEHPAHSHAWEMFDLPVPDRCGGWYLSPCGFAVAHVEQGHYGHVSRKATWLLARPPCRLPELIWGPAPQRLPAYAVARYGYEKARRIGMVGAIGGKDKKALRNRTPPVFRDLLLHIAGRTDGR